MVGKGETVFSLVWHRDAPVHCVFYGPPRLRFCDAFGVLVFLAKAPKYCSAIAILFFGRLASQANTYLGLPARNRAATGSLSLGIFCFGCAFNNKELNPSHPWRRFTYSRNPKHQTRKFSIFAPMFTQEQLKDLNDRSRELRGFL